MFRASSYVLSVRTLLYRRHPSDFQIATITRFPPAYKYKIPKERETCLPPKPPPVPPPRDGKLFWGAMALLVLAGGCVVFAKSSPEIRDWLTINAPWLDDFIAVLYQENMTYGEFAVTCIEDAKRFLASYTSDDNKPKKCSLEGGKVLNYDVPEQPKEEDEDALMECEPEPPPVVTQDICEIHNCMIDLGETVINNYNTARDACACYNRLVAETMETFTYEGLTLLKPAKRERICLVKESLNNAETTMNKLDMMVKYLDCGVQASKNQIEICKTLHRDLHEKFKAAYTLYQWENDKSIASDRQWKMVEELIQKYITENEAMYPGLDYGAKIPMLTGDPDIMLYSSYRYVNQLTDILKEYSEGMTERINRAIDSLPQSEQKLKAREADLEAVVKLKRVELDKEFKQREDNQKADNEKKLQALFKKQLERHEETLAIRLVAKEKELMGKFDVMIAEKVDAEKRLFDAELAEMSLKLRHIEEKLEARLKAERETRRSQELWAAGASLLEATKKGDPYVKIDKELQAIEKASGEDDKLVETVLKSIPPSVREKGVVPESVLKEGFRVMEKTARSVALVEQDGAAMPVYMLSWLQGLMLFMKVSGIPQAEYDKPLEPPENLDTFDLLQRAAFWMERGNLAAAVRYISSLQGASRAAAAKWFEAARAHLEVRQAAEAVLAHAAAMGLQYI